MKINKLLIGSIVIIIVILSAYFILNKPSDDVNISSLDTSQSSSIELQSQDLSQSSSNDNQSANNGEKPFSISPEIKEIYGNKVSLYDVKLYVGSDGLCYIDGTISIDTDYEDLNMALMNFDIYDMNNRFIEGVGCLAENFYDKKTSTFSICLGNGISIDDISRYELSMVDGPF